MVRTQIQLTEEQARRVKQIARHRGVSMATVIRDAVDRLADDRDERRAAAWSRALAVAGKHRGGPGDVAEEHDAELARAFEDWR